MLHTMFDCELELIRNNWPAAKKQGISFSDFLRDLRERCKISDWSFKNVTQLDAEEV